MGKVQVEIWSDVCCPWCFIGKRRFEKGLEAFEHKDQVEVQWRSYQISPDFPKRQATSILEFLTKHKGISAGQAQGMFQNITALAAKEGLSFNFGVGLHSNTFDAHRLIHFASESGSGREMKERLMSAYFEKGENVGDLETLAQLGAQVTGKTLEVVRSALTSDSYVANVNEDQIRGKQIGVSSVPFFWINRKHKISGAESPEAFTEALRKARSQMDQQA